MDFERTKGILRRKGSTIISSPYVSSVLIITLFWMGGYGYTFYTYIDESPWWLILILSTILLTLISFLSLYPLLVYALFRYMREYQTRQKMYLELTHYDMLTPSLESEIRYSNDITYKSSNYRIAVPLTVFVLALGWFLFFF